MASVVTVAQQTPEAPRAVSGTVGSMELAYTTRLEAGDYIAGTMTSFGQPLVLTVLAPNGSTWRTFVSGRSGETPFDFVADMSGFYRFQLQTLDRLVDTQAPARYELNVRAPLSLNARFAREPVWSAFV